MKKTAKTLTTIGSAVASTFAANVANAESNPFAMSQLNSGYMQLAQSDKAGEMKCGSKMKMNKQKEAACGEGSCGSMMEDGKMKKGMESACGAMMKGKEGACGMQEKAAAKKEKNKGYSVSKTGWGNKKSASDDLQKGKEGKCGEGTCGGMMQGDKMKKGMEGSCGDMMKGKEGTCGMGMKGKGDMQGMDMKGGEASCGAMVSPEKAAGE
ncbi:copper-binding oxazolone/thioamide-containing RiPP [Methyloprofundus sp.]|uniref:HvfA family oxazolone/thioamide-modified RiPP metallophore n=1 Tax=Methyloprofundus sp. TaxID=2020875 RepID=UPI003D0CE7E1